MAAKFRTLRDQSYVNGMNSVDDAKALPDTQCCELVNAFPDYPVKLRRGCDGKILQLNNHPQLPVTNIIGKPFDYVFYNNKCLLAWIEHGSFAHLCSVQYADNLNGDELYPYVRAVKWRDNNEPVMMNTNNLNFDCDFVSINNIVLTRMSWGGMPSQQIPRMLALDYNPIELEFWAREIPDSNSGAFVALSSLYGGEFFKVEYDEYGVFDKPFQFGYSVTLIRRIDVGADEVGTTFTPGLIESTEFVDTRGAIARTEGAQFPASIYLRPQLRITADRINRCAFTHVRFYRTVNLYGLPPDEQELKGAERLFLVDVPVSRWIDDREYWYKDTVSVGALTGEMNLLTMDTYTLPPSGGYKMIYHKHRLFLMTDTDVFFSEAVGLDEGTDLAAAQLAPEKFALMFRPLEWRIELSRNSHARNTTMASLADELYLFTSDHVYMIVGGNPLAAPHRALTEITGCPFADGVCSARIAGRDVLFFLGDDGAMIIAEGGNYRRFSEFKVKDLWPDTGSLLFDSSRDGARVKQIRRVSAAYWNDAVWVLYSLPKQLWNGTPNPDYTHKIFAFADIDDTRGACEIRIADMENRYRIDNIIPISNNRAVTIAFIEDKNWEYSEEQPLPDNKIAFVDFLRNETSYDALYNGELIVEAVRPNFEITSRKFMPGPREKDISELFRLIAYCDFSEDRLDDQPFRIDVTSNRYRTWRDYYSDGTVFQSNQFGAAVEGVSFGGVFSRTDGGAWEPDSMVGYTAYVYADTPQSRDDGFMTIVRSNTSDTVTFDVAIGGQGFYTHIRFIARSTVRTNIQFIPERGFAGEFFQYKLTKVMPSTRHFNWYGAEIDVIPRPQLADENLTGGMTTSIPNRNAWE